MVVSHGVRCMQWFVVAALMTVTRSAYQCDLRQEGLHNEHEAQQIWKTTQLAMEMSRLAAYTFCTATAATEEGSQKQALLSANGMHTFLHPL